MGLVERLLLYNDPAFSVERVAPSYHSIIRDEDKPGVVFAFVRHPLTWYRSYWAWKSRLFFWNPYNPLDRTCADPDFEVFIGNVIKNFPGGYLNNIYPFFLQHCTHAGRFENLKNDLISILKIAGEPFDAECIHNAPPRLSSAEVSGQVKYSPELALGIMKIDRNICDLFGYRVIDDLLK